MTVYRAAPLRPVLACPRDSSPLEPRRVGGLDVHHCVGCRGVWIESAELVRLHADAVLPASITDDEIAYGRRSPEGQPDESLPVRCCSCGRTARRHLYSGGAHVHIDTCREHGIWLDGGELFAIAYSLREGRLTRSPAPAPASSFVAGVLEPPNPLEVALGAIIEGLFGGLF